MTALQAHILALVRTRGPIGLQEIVRHFRGRLGPTAALCLLQQLENVGLVRRSPAGGFESSPKARVHHYTLQIWRLDEHGAEHRILYQEATQFDELDETFQLFHASLQEGG